MIKVKTKSKVILSLILVVVTILFCGCGTLTSSLVTNADDSVEESVVVTLDTDKLLDYGYSTNKILELKNDIKNRATNVANQYVQRLYNKANTDISRTADQDTQALLTEYRSGLTVTANAWDEMTYTITLKFASTDVYKYFYDVTDEQTVTPTLEKHFLYTKYVYKGHTMYYKHSSLYDEFYNFVAIKYPEILNANEGEMYYTTAVALRRQHSNADTITRKDGQYYHTWKVTDKNQEIEFYYIVANKTVCVSIAVGVSAVVLMILGIVGLILKNKKTNQIA